MRTGFPWFAAGAGRRPVLKGVMAFAMSMVLAACGGGSSSDPEPTPQAKARVTVLVYVVGSDLEGERPSGQTGDMATGNIEEMMTVGSTDDVHVILETGGAKKAGWETVKRQRVLKGDLQLVEDLGAQRMSDPENLRKFIEWGVQAYPAEKYHLVFWNHGGGPLHGFGSDQNYPNTGMMSVSQIQQALEGAKGATGVKIDMVGFDACLMASVEIAEALSPYANYLVASEEVEPGRGWDWAAYLRHMVDNADSTALSTGKAIVDSYVEKMRKSGSEMVTLSLVDLNKVGALTQSLGELFASISAQLESATPEQRYKIWSELAYARRTSVDFQTSWFFDNEFDLVDVGDFMSMPKFAGLDVTEEQVDAVRQSLEQAVVYARQGEQFWGSSGLTMYFPLVGVGEGYAEGVRRHYDSLPVPAALKNIVNQYLTMAESTDWPAPQVGPIQSGDDDVAYADVSNPAFQAVSYAALWRNEGGTMRMLAMKPLDAAMSQNGEDPAEQETIRIAAHRDTGWLGIPQAAGSSKLVPVSVLPDDMPHFDVDAVLQYTIPVNVMPAGTSGGFVEGLLMVSAIPDGEYTEGEWPRKRIHRIVGFIGAGNNPYASRPDPEIPVGSTILPQRWSAQRQWESEVMSVDDQIISQEVGDADTPRDQWWTLEPMDVSQDLCANLDCMVELGVVDYQGRFQYAQEAAN